MKLKRENDYAKYFLTVQHANSAIRNATHRGQQQQQKTETEEKNGIYESMNVMMCVYRSAPFCPSHIMM